MIQFTIPLCPVTKKNHSQIIHCGGGHKLIPSKQYRKYELDAGWYIKNKCMGIDYSVNVKALYYMGKDSKVDLSNLNAALHDLLVHYGVLADDNSKIIVSTDGSRVYVDPKNPRTEVYIDKL